MSGRQWILSLVLATMLAGGTRLHADDAKPTPAAPALTKDEEYYRLMEILADTFEQIERNYVKEVDRRKLVEAAIRGMLEPLEDPYSNYISPDELGQFTQVIEQEFGGIGIQVELDPVHHRLTVTSPLPGSPAHKAGIKAGDMILDIEGKTTNGMTLEDAVKLMKGPIGESVKVNVRHLDMKTEQLTVTRAKIQLKTVLGDVYRPDGTWDFMLDKEKKIGYIRLTSFSRETTSELKKALDELVKQGMTALVLDLRNDPGGLLQAATDIADMFLEEGVIVSTKGRNTEPRVFEARKKGTYPNFPMAVLVNRYSASASEILSAALQDHNRAVVVGERTWGKGSVQNVIQMEENKSALKLTTASYHRPSGKNIHRFKDALETDEWGVMPNEGYAIKFSNDELVKYNDFRRHRDVLKEDAPDKSDFVDTQLNKALEYITGKLAAKDVPEAEKKPEEKKDGEAKDSDKKTDKGEAALRREILPRPARPFIVVI